MDRAALKLHGQAANDNYHRSRRSTKVLRILYAAGFGASILYVAFFVGVVL